MHPWIALEDGQSFLTGPLTDEAKEQKQQQGAPAEGRQTPLPPAVADGLKKRSRPGEYSLS